MHGTRDAIVIFLKKRVDEFCRISRIRSLAAAWQLPRKRYANSDATPANELIEQRC